jgi:alpha-galactosidase
MTYGLAQWLPFYGSGCFFDDPYSCRSFYQPLFGMNSPNMQSWAQAYAECRRVAPYMLGDYYPLTPYSRGLDQWIAWQFDRPESGDGMIQAFRRASNRVASQTFVLKGLDPASHYELTNLDVPGAAIFSGETLMTTGVKVPISTTPGSVIIIYKKKGPP